MCKVIQLNFACGHHVWVRKSMCNGTYRRPATSGYKASCSATPYMEIHLESACGCQFLEWDVAWQLRLLRGEHHIHDLITQRLPCVELTIALQEFLKEQYDSLAWQVRKEHPAAGKTPFGRAPLRLFPIGGSPLRNELKPEDFKDKGTRSLRSPTPLSWPEVELDTNGYPVCFTGTYENPLFQAVPDSGVYGGVGEEEEMAPFDTEFEFNRGWDWVEYQGSSSSSSSSNSSSSSASACSSSSAKGKAVAHGPEADTGGPSSSSPSPASTSSSDKGKAVARDPEDDKGGPSKSNTSGMQGHYNYKPRYPETERAIQGAIIYFWKAVKEEPVVRIPERRTKKTTTKTTQETMAETGETRPPTPALRAVDNVADPVTVITLDPSSPQFAYETFEKALAAEPGPSTSTLNGLDDVANTIAVLSLDSSNTSPDSEKAFI